MADPPDPDALARRFVTLWQEQMLAVAADPAVADATARWLSLFAPAFGPSPFGAGPAPFGVWPSAAGFPQPATGSPA